MAGIQMGAISHRLICHRSDDCPEVAFLTGSSTKFHTLISCAMIAVISITFGFKIVNLSFLLEGSMIADLNKFYFYQGLNMILFTI